MAQSPIVVTSDIESGWTSNASDSAVGEGDFYVSHNQKVSLTGETGNFVLRGSLAISQTRFLKTTFENDDGVAGAVEAELALGDNAVLRLGYAVTRSWTGDDLSIGGLVVPIRSDETQHSYSAELAVAGQEQQVTVGVDADFVAPGDTMLVGFGLPPVRLAPNVGSVAVRVGWERALSPTVAALAGLEAWFTTIPEDEQLTYLRAPADGGRVAAGLRMDDGVVTLQGSGGLDLVWPKGWTDLTQTSPYFAVAASFAPSTDVTLAATVETGVELADPLDGVAGGTASIEIGAAWLLAPGLTLSAKLAGWQERGLFDPNLFQTRRTARLGAVWAISDHFNYGATLSLSRHEGPVESYDKTGLALTISGAL